MVNAELKQDTRETKPGPVVPDQFAALGENAPGHASGGAAIAEPSMEGIAGLGAASTASAADERQYPQGVEDIRPKEFEQLSPSITGGASRSIDMLLDVSLPVSIELGRTTMPIQDILNLGTGSVIELDKLAGEPVDLLVNEKLIARGEVVVVDENFGIRITSMIAPQERIKSLK